MKRVFALFATGFLLIAACQKEEPSLPPTPPSPQPVEDGGEINVENPTVKSYLDLLEAYPYRDNDYSYTNIDGFWQVNTTYRKDRPAPATVIWERDPECISQRVSVSDNPDFEGAFSQSAGTTESSFGICNMTPGGKYWWKIEAMYPGGEWKTLKKGSFTATGRRRFLSIDNMCNVRDLGGIPTTDGRVIKYGLIYRGGEMDGGRFDNDHMPCKISSNGIKAMKHAGIAAVLDLRTAAEALDDVHSPLGKDVDYIRFETANAYYYDKFWQTDVYIKAFQWAIDELRAGKPVYFHCIYGADRTGTLGFLIEALLGVSESNLAADYELTSFSYGLNDPPRRRGPKNSVSVYRYKEMLQGVKTSSSFSGNGIQERIRNFLLNGYPGSKGASAVISEADLDWFTDFMLE